MKTRAKKHKAYCVKFVLIDRVACRSCRAVDSAARHWPRTEPPYTQQISTQRPECSTDSFACLSLRWFDERTLLNQSFYWFVPKDMNHQNDSCRAPHLYYILHKNIFYFFTLVFIVFYLLTIHILHYWVELLIFS